MSEDTLTGAPHKKKPGNTCHEEADPSQKTTGDEGTPKIEPFFKLSPFEPPFINRALCVDSTVMILKSSQRFPEIFRGF